MMNENGSIRENREVNKLIEISKLQVNLVSAQGVVHAVRNVDLDICAGEVLGLVGESGCGKTITAKSIMRLNNEESLVYRGRILCEGEDLLSLSERKMRDVRGSVISMIFQDPSTALDPLQRIGRQIEEVFLLRGVPRKTARKEAQDMLAEVGIFPPEERSRSYPFEMSGGQLQRVMIAIALSAGPKLLIADEPTTSLDVTVQAQILELLRSLQKKLGMSVLVITHNFGIVAEICDRVAVMYAGRIVEIGSVSDIFHDARHPYTRDLIVSIPKSGSDKPVSIPGMPPDLREVIVGCPYAPRCKYADEACNTERPVMQSISDSRRFACRKNIPGKAEAGTIKASGRIDKERAL
jgi:oligopeptide/dipeptide ABC transporter ATP-binding protein